ncbi:MAG: Radical domain protein [Pedosphaera sp.]|jgi:radical SAM protein with 4Fe4S-binding SPASM domain|nr:Radical domain protein [Pedosphaera sp.]
MNTFVNFAKKIYDTYPGLVNKSGLYELFTTAPYRSFYMKKIESKMEEFLNGAVTVEFEVTNHCNADCIMCPNSIMQRPSVRMQMDLFKRVVDELAAENLPLIKFVFAGIGEPTLDPQLPEKIAYLKAKIPKVPVQLTTNASLLTEKKSKDLIEAGLDRVMISFNGTTKESYEAVMGHMSYEKTMANLMTFLSQRKDGKPHLTISCVRLDANSKDFERLEEFWKEKGVQVDGFKTPIPFNRGGDKMKYKSRWTMPKPTAPRHFYPCRMMAENMLIHPNGTVVLCFVDYEEKHVMGQFGKDTLRQIMQKKREWFERHKKGDFSHTPLCKNCSFMREQVVSWWKDSYF